MKNLFAHIALAIIILVISVVPTAAQQRGLAVLSNQSPDAAWGAYHALVIGINDYQEWPKLQTAVKDATVIRNLLVERYGFAEKNVILRTDKAASRFQIERDLRYLATAMEPTDNLLIYYAGHGQLDDLTGDGYWVPAEGAMKNPSTWVANSYVKAIFSSEKVQAKNVVVIADSCYSGSMLRGGPSLMSLDDKRYRKKLARKAALRSRQVISSGGVEPVADGGAEGHSLFAFYLIDALRKNDREVIDLENLFHTKVWKKVTEIGDQSPNVGRLKTPMDQDGQFVLYNAAWAREQQARRATADAEQQKQVQAQQKAAVASAELELQRQRMEIEKQRLTMEKEQLAQQKALELEMLKQKQAIEMERIKLEKQKQEIEYAKLQARLSEMETRQKTNEKLARGDSSAGKPLLAAVPPATTKPPRAPANSYRLAILPFNYYTSHTLLGGSVEEYEMDTINKIASWTEESERIALQFSYQLPDRGAKSVTLLKDVLKNEELEVWKKKTMFSSKEPDWDLVRNMGQKIGANPVVVGAGDIGIGQLTIYLYDTENGKVYTRSGKAYLYVVAEAGRDIVINLFKEFLEDQ